VSTERKIWIANGAGHLGRITQQQMTWPEYVEWQRQIYVALPATRAQYAALDADKKAALKKSLAFSLGAKYSGTARKGTDLEQRETLNIDLDKLSPQDYAAVLAAAQKLDRAYVHVGSASNEVNGKRSGRLIFPLSRPVEPTLEFAALSRKVAEKLGIEHVDPVSHQKNQICYVPARCSDAPEVFEEHAVEWLDVDAVLAEYADFKDPTQWPRTSREISVAGETALLGDPGEKPRLVGAFCRQYDVLRAIETFDLPYDSTPDERRWTPHGASSSGGARIYGHPTDPAAASWMFNSHTNGLSPQRNLCSYDAVRLHRFGELDKDVPADTAINKLPSSTAMEAWIRAEHPDIAADADRAQEADPLAFEDLDAAEGPLPDTSKERNDELEAQFRITDQANAKRLADAFGKGKRLCSVAGVFYAWSKNGTHWVADSTNEVRRCAQALSKLIRREASVLRRSAEAAETTWQSTITPEQRVEARNHPRTPKHSLEQGADYEKFKKLDKEAASLEAWAMASEMTPRQDAALKQLKECLDKEDLKLDANRALLNCPNGTIDLRTGELRPHNPVDFITVCAPTAYNPDAKAPRFEACLRDIFNGDDETIDFVQRWYGYCATGEVGEQKFLIQSGEGSNGKGFILHSVDAVLGPDYSCPAPPTLLADSGRGNDRHPTEIAKLKGKRLVSAQEPDRSAVLREGLIKWMTGGDKLTARGMREDFSDFDPTHKLQLLTNYEPVIKSRDNGILRRPLLLLFPNIYGTPEEIAAGKATHVKNMRLETELLRDEKEGILAWIVQGAKEWYRQGLNPPSSVLAATRAYLDKQDRVGAFVRDRCVLDPMARTAYNGPTGLYTAYRGWCQHEEGHLPLSKDNFISDLKRAVPQASAGKWQEKSPDGTYPSERGLYGIRLRSESFEDLEEQEQTPAPQPEAPAMKAKTDGSAAAWVDDPVTPAKANGAAYEEAAPVAQTAAPASADQDWRKGACKSYVMTWPLAQAATARRTYARHNLRAVEKGARNGVASFEVTLPVDGDKASEVVKVANDEIRTGRAA
jgi:P4 family phage/plasmid primase-like protien